MSSKLKSHETMNWIKNRFKNQAKDKYLLNDKEWQEQIMMKAVFNSIDRDKSKYLDRSELYDMFQRFGIAITRQKLKEFFKKIDQDDDDKLNWNDFKQALTNQEALQMFAELMRKLRQNYQGNSFVPLSFQNMIQYMNYCVLREELIQKINSEECTAAQKIKHSRHLLSLEEICYRNIQSIQEENESEIDINQHQKKLDPHQLAQQRRIQELERKQKLQQRIRKLSSSIYYKSTQQDEPITSGRDSNQKTLLVNIHNSIQQTERKYGDILDTLTQNNIQSNEYTYKVKQESTQVSSPYKIEYTQPVNSIYNSQASKLELEQSEYTTKRFQSVRKQSESPTKIPKGGHFINQYCINTRNPVTIKQILSRHTAPRKRRVLSQLEPLKSKSQIYNNQQSMQ
ncbi:hypothetical protein pb186bvf_004896 [Paramecium bursaria]